MEQVGVRDYLTLLCEVFMRRGFLPHGQARAGTHQ